MNRLTSLFRPLRSPQRMMALCLAGLVGLLAFGPLPCGAANTVSWKTGPDRMSADIRGAKLEEVLTLIGEATGWQVFVQPLTDQTQDVKFVDRPASDALKLLLGKLNYALIASTQGPQKLLVFRTGIGEATERIGGKSDPRIDTSKPIPTELVITVKPGVDVEALAKKYGGKVISKIPELRTYRLEFETAEAAEKARKELEKDPDVEKVQNNYYVEKPQDLQGVDLSSLNELNLKSAEGADDCSKVVIGLIDTTVPRTGGQLDQLLMPQIDIAGPSTLTGNSPPHGRSMADAIARAADVSSKGQAKIGILPINVYGGSDQASTFAVAQGVYKAIQSGAKIINLSLGSAAPSQLLSEIITQGRSQDIIFVAAAGNSPTTQATYPAADPGVVAVTASDRSGQIASYANRGDFVDVIAPGSSIFQYNGQTYLSSGTSVATAYVSGLAASMADPCKKTYSSVETQVRQNLSVNK